MDKKEVTINSIRFPWILVTICLVIPVSLVIAFSKSYIDIVFLLLTSGFIFMSLLYPNTTVCLIIACGCTVFNFVNIPKIFYPPYQPSSLPYAYFLPLLIIVVMFLLRYPESMNILVRDKFALLYFLFFLYLLFKIVIQGFIIEKISLLDIKSLYSYVMYTFYFYLLLSLSGKFNFKKVFAFLTVLGVIGIILQIVLFFSPIENVFFPRHFFYIENPKKVYGGWALRTTSIIDEPSSTFYHSRIEWPYQYLFALLFFIFLSGFLMKEGRRNKLYYGFFSLLFLTGSVFSFKKLFIVGLPFVALILLFLWGWQHRKLINALFIWSVLVLTVLSIVVMSMGKEERNVTYSRTLSEVSPFSKSHRMRDIKNVLSLPLNNLIFGASFEDMENLGVKHFFAGFACITAQIGFLGLFLFLMPFIYYIADSAKKILLKNSNYFQTGSMGFFLFLMLVTIFNQHILLPYLIIPICLIFFVSSHTPNEKTVFN